VAWDDLGVSQTGSQRSSYDELLALVEALAARVSLLEAENAELRVDNAALRTENIALKRKLETDSTNSSTPPSQDSLAAKGKRRAQRSQRMDAVEGPETRWPAGT
jgi:hypothetical protein